MTRFNRFDASILATLLMLVTGITAAMSWQAYNPIYGLILISYIACFYFIGSQIESIWTPYILYSLCLVPISCILTCNSGLDKYLLANNYAGVLQAVIALCLSLMLYYIVTEKPFSAQLFLGLEIIGIFFTRNYTFVYCLFLLLYLYTPLSFKLRRLLSKYLWLIRLLLLPFILVSLPLILAINSLASCPIFAILLLTYARVFLPKQTGEYL